MSNLIPEPPYRKRLEELSRQFANLSKKELLALMRDAMNLTIEGVLNMAAVVVSWHHQGFDFSELGINGLSEPLMRVADGRMLPEILCAFLLKPKLLKKCGDMSFKEQEKLASGEKVELVTFGPDGKMDKVMRGPTELLPKEIDLVFANDHIRDAEEQMVILKRERDRMAMPLPEQFGPIKVDYQRGIFTVGRTDFSPENAEAALKAMKKKRNV